MLESFINNWLTFLVCFTLLLIVSFAMMKQGSGFYTKDIVIKKFSIMELEVPASPDTLYRLIKGLYALPEPDSKKSVAALKGQLRLDFLFMPLAYGCLFLLCWRVSGKMESGLGKYLFIELAFLQLVPWLCDIIENIYLLNKIKPDIEDPKQMNRAGQQAAIKKHKNYLRMEAVKWGISLTALVCALSAVCYCWFTGTYSRQSLYYLLAVIGELAVFFFAVRAQKK